jgi:gamma-butyrobetaine dioxygenase
MSPIQEATMSPVDEVVALFAQRGHEYHGEVVDQRRHALQCATLARSAGAEDHLVAAALLHDVGHFLSGDDGDPGFDPAVDDDYHEALGARWVAARFGPAVARPVALHVLAKRYRCTVDPAYLAALSPASVLSQQVQGGLLDTAAVARFEAQPGSADALALRQWDEEAKDPDRQTDGIEAFLTLLESQAVLGSGRTVDRRIIDTAR